jgi:hypothetical protein
MGADHHPRARRRERCQDGVALGALVATGEPADLDAQGFEPAAQAAQMLLRQQLGRRHQRHLITGLHRLQCRQGADHGLAGADIAL